MQLRVGASQRKQESRGKDCPGVHASVGHVLRVAAFAGGESMGFVTVGGESQTGVLVDCAAALEHVARHWNLRWVTRFSRSVTTTSVRNPRTPSAAARDRLSAPEYARDTWACGELPESFGTAKENNCPRWRLVQP